MKKCYFVMKDCKGAVVDNISYRHFKLMVVTDADVETFLCSVREEKLGWGVEYITPIPMVCKAPSDFVMTAFSELRESYYFKSVMAEIVGSRTASRTYTCRYNPGSKTTRIYEHPTLKTGPGKEKGE